MSSKGGKRPVPALRFPEFLEADTWTEIEFGKVISLEYGNPLPESAREGGRVPVVGSNGVVGFHDVAITKGPTIVVGRKGSAGQVSWFDSDCFPIDTTFFVKNLVPADLSMRFLFLLLENCRLEKLKDDGAVPGINRNSVYALKPFSPSRPEQQKIAACLSSLDDLITAQAKKIEALKAHKKGLMQQLFPAEGETVPRLRFPDFQGGPDWIPAKLGDVSTIKSGGTPSRTNPDYWSGTIPWVTTSLIDSNIILNVDEHITKLGLEGSSAKIFPKGTILMAMYGQGKTRGKVAVLGIDAATNQACAAILVKKKIEPSFVFQNLASRYEEIRRISNSGGQENLSAGLIEGIPIAYPGGGKEQKLIASCLSCLDDLVAAQTKKLELLKIHKQGLMQGLFPSINEAEA